MKRLLSLALIIGSLHVSAQKIKPTEVPSDVRATFAKAYPAISKAKWEKEDGNYEVAFEKEEKKMTLVIDKTGKLLQTEVIIKEAALPAAAKTYLDAHYAGKKRKDMAHITKASGEVEYEVEVNKKDVIFDASGKFLKEEEDKD